MREGDRRAGGRREVEAVHTTHHPSYFHGIIVFPSLAHFLFYSISGVCTYFIPPFLASIHCFPIFFDSSTVSFNFFAMHTVLGSFFTLSFTKLLTSSPTLRHSNYTLGTLDVLPHKLIDSLIKRYRASASYQGLHVGGYCVMCRDSPNSHLRLS